MSVGWGAGSEPPETSIEPLGWIRAVLRGLVLAVLVFGGLIVLLLLRLIERPLFGVKRPLTPFITQAVCRTAFVVLGIGFATSGHQMRRIGAVVANHSSWLDIFALNAKKRVYFVSKAEVAAWPGIGWLARATGTVFINRDRREAAAQVKLFETRLDAGHKLLFFPEGTSTDSRRVLPFKSTLFAAFFTPHLREVMHVQPVTVIYHAPKGADSRFYGWWGDMDFGPHLLKVLACARPGRVELVYHEPVRVSEFDSRKALAGYCEATVRAPLALAGLDHAPRDQGSENPSV
ncbi:lysophospholipid acyltransferase family protein [Aliiroseovarius subalbicans]|uniref:lysophospholipid acyltransferase family protein n=1 Tax=Aliiroseovarius subalbicans TaxID=2925840 RepID=UPI001F577401|nr:lysophospholipid acyltransferase family protein [Aliiroseovarius subalbicans]MCI2398310.1 1-acyl-sn-glycerol-3-phosphate acyltransferase [Aliiroseovarius subalbicans]